jgi:hypothetical protein
MIDDGDSGFADEVLTNAKLLTGWRLIDGLTGRVDIAEADTLAAVRSWFELEAEWQRTQ